MAFIASALALRSVWQVRIRSSLTLGLVGTGYLFREADQRPTLPCSGKPVVSLWDFYFKFISIHYQDVFKVEMGVKISGIYHKI